MIVGLKTRQTSTITINKHPTATTVFLQIHIVTSSSFYWIDGRLRMCHCSGKLLGQSVKTISYTSKRMRSASNQWWWWCEVTEKCHFLRYESSTLIFYKEQSSTIFPLWVSQSGIGDTCPDLHFLQYIKAWMSSTDPVLSITNCYRLIVSYTDPVHSFIIL